MPTKARNTPSVPTVDVIIDREGLDPGHALIYCRADARMDGRLGRSEGKIYIETYGTDDTEPVCVTASSAQAAVRKLARALGLRAGAITTER
jgi:hypothetical protein